MTTEWTVRMETNLEHADVSARALLQNTLPEGMRAEITCGPRGSALTCTLTLAEHTLPRAVTLACAVFARARANADVGADAAVVRVSGQSEERLAHSPVPPLIAPRGLAERCGQNEARLRQVLKHVDAPALVPVEGQARVQVYRLDEALRFIDARR